MPRLNPPARPNSNSDLYSRVTDAILAELETGVRPWTRPWSVNDRAGPVSRPLRSTGEPYKGVNILLLWAEALNRGYGSPVWITFRQALALGGHVRRGERGATVVYADRLVRAETDEAGQEVERSIPFLKAYTVFNVEQVEGLPDAFLGPPVPRIDPTQRIAHAERFFAGLGADIRHGGAEAYYAIGLDQIRLPPFESFCDPEAYYATLAHEGIHWTRHPSRLDRDFGRSRWGDEGYATEELVAELGAAFLCADLGLELTPRSDHASYIAGWLEALRNDRRFIFTAAAHAQRACDLLLSRSPG